MTFLRSLAFRSAVIAALIIGFVSVIRENSEWLVPLGLFNLSCVLGIPGTLIMWVLLIVFLPGAVHTATGHYPPYNYLSYLGDFFFYFGLWYLVLWQMRKWSELPDSDGK